MVHLFQQGGLNIVADTFSGSIHVVDEAAYDVIRMFENSSRDEITEALGLKYKGDPEVTPEEIGECYDEIAALKEAGKLFSEDVFAPMAGRLKERAANVVKALCLHVAHTCNLHSSE